MDKPTEPTELGSGDFSLEELLPLMAFIIRGKLYRSAPQTATTTTAWTIFTVVSSFILIKQREKTRTSPKWGHCCIVLHHQSGTMAQEQYTLIT